MKSTALVFILSIILFLTPSIFASNTSVKNNVDIDVNGGGSNVNVDINNNFKTSSQTVKSSSKADVNINHKGEGSSTSNVSVNGKNWHLEGPGKISVSEGTSSSSPTSVNSATENQETKNAIEKIIKQLENLILKIKLIFKL